MELSDDDDNEPDHVGSTLDADGDAIMELTELSDEENDLSEDEETELSKVTCIFMSSPITLIAIRVTYQRMECTYLCILQACSDC
jgi:hypothetical protein